MLYVYTQQEADDKPLDLLKIPKGLDGEEAARVGFAERKLTVNITETTKRRKELKALEKSVVTPTSTTTTTGNSSPRRTTNKQQSTRTAVTPEPPVSKVKLLEPNLGPVPLSKKVGSNNKGGGSTSKRPALKKRANLSLMGATGGKATGQNNTFRNRSLPPQKPSTQIAPITTPKANSHEIEQTNSTSKESGEQEIQRKQNASTPPPDLQKISNQNQSQNLLQNQAKNQNQNQSLGKNQSQEQIHILDQQKAQNTRNAQIQNLTSVVQSEKRIKLVGKVNQSGKNESLENQVLQDGQVKNQLQDGQVKSQQQGQLGGFGSFIPDSKTPENSDQRQFVQKLEPPATSSKGPKILLKKNPQSMPKINISNSNNNNVSNIRPQLQQQQQQLPQQNINTKDDRAHAQQNNFNNDVPPVIKTSIQLKSSSARKILDKSPHQIPDFQNLKPFLISTEYKQFDLAVLSMLHAADQRGLSLQEIYEPLQIHYYSKFNFKYERLVLENLLRKHSKYSHNNFKYTLTQESKIKFEKEYLRDLIKGNIPPEFLQKSPIQSLSPSPEQHVKNVQNANEIQMQINNKITQAVTNNDKANTNKFENNYQQHENVQHVPPQIVKNSQVIQENPVQNNFSIKQQQQKQLYKESPKIVQESSSQGEGQSSSQAAVKTSSGKRQLFEQQQQQQQQQQQRSIGGSASDGGQPPKKLKLVIKKDVVQKEILESGELPPTQYQDDRDRIIKNQGRTVVSDGALVNHESLIVSDDSQPDQLSYESKSKKRRVDEVNRKEVEGSTAVVLPQLLLPEEHLYERYCSGANMSTFIQPPAISSTDEFMLRRKQFAEEYNVYSELYRCFEKAKEILKHLKQEEKQSSIVEFMEKYEPYLEKIDTALCLLEKKLLPERSQLLCYYELSIKPNI